jgi:hypothetical protein
MNFYLGSRSLNPKFTLIVIYILSISVTFAANSGDLGRSILAHILTSSSVINIDVIINLSLISKASLVSRIALQDLLRGYDYSIDSSL